jgi:hypothetical protein
MLGLINRLLGRHKTTLPPFDFMRNRFPAKKKWPPNLRNLTDKQNFRFERKFKRRIKLKAVSAGPRLYSGASSGSLSSTACCSTTSHRIR